MSTSSIVFSFHDSTTADGNRYAGSLAEMLRGVDADIRVERIRESPDRQDFGASLAVVLGTAAVTSLAKGIASWLARNSGAKMEIRRNGQVLLTVSHLNSTDVPKLAEALHAAGVSDG